MKNLYLIKYLLLYSNFILYVLFIQILNLLLYVHLYNLGQIKIFQNPKHQVIYHKYQKYYKPLKIIKLLVMLFLIKLKIIILFT